MRKLIHIFLVMTIFLSCTQPDRWEIISNKEKFESATGIKNDTIFLGFAFGMTENQVNDKFRQLLKDEKISAPQKYYEYKFDFEYPRDVLATFQTEYFKSKLCKLSLKIECNSKTESELIYTQLISRFMTKYGLPIAVPSILDKKEKDYLFINGNRKIELNYPFINIVVISYIDFPALNEKDRLEMIGKSKKDSLIIKDI